MNDRDPWSELRDLSEATGQSVIPLSPESIRRLGAQRRRRRHLAVGAVAAVLVVGVGGAVIGQTVNQARPDLPQIARTPTATVTPTAAGTTPTAPTTSTPTAPVTATPAQTRKVDLDNVITTNDLPIADGVNGEWAEIPPTANDWNPLSICQEETFADLGVTSQAGRIFRFEYEYGPGDIVPDPTSTHTGAPTDYALALQFSDQATAEKAYQHYHDWISDCSDNLTERAYQPVGDDLPVKWAKTNVDQGTAEWAEIRYVSASDDTDGVFQSVGLLLDGDRLAITVSYIFGQDHYYSQNQDGEIDAGQPPHPQFRMLTESSRVLGS